MELTVEKYEGKIGVAVSGGIDSMCLLHAYCSVNQDLTVINVEHGIRGENSLRDTDFVRAYCKLNNIPFLTRSVNAVSSAKPGESTETCARRLRYEFFDELLSSGTVKKIALAHHADDNAETVLMRIFRGTGLRGLAGIGNRSDYIRPLITYTRKQIEEYAEFHSVPFVTDETNLSSDYTRNYIRNELMPVITAKFGDVPKAITRLSECAKEADEYLTSVCPKFERKSDGLHIKNFFGYPIILQKYAIMNAIRELGYLQDFENRHVESVCELKSKPNNTVINLPFNLVCVKYNDGVIVAKNNGSGFCPLPFSEDGVYSFSGICYYVKKGEGMIKGATLDGDKLPNGCVVRTRRDGDVFKRVNGKTKLLSDYLNGEKLSRIEKDSVLVLAKGNRIYAVFGLDTADEVKITEETKNILHIIREYL